MLSGEGGSGDGTEAEVRMTKVLREGLKASGVIVRDISGGCGSMYHIIVVSDEFKGVNRVKQHRMVNSLLEEDIKAAHGVVVETYTPEKYEAER